MKLRQLLDSKTIFGNPHQLIYIYLDNRQSTLYRYPFLLSMKLLWRQFE